jgi:glycosyltransferase involved in cell wall biosynthesis
MPSLHEGFGYPPLEAMACGTPVASSYTTSLGEIVGDAALTFDPTDVSAIADALIRLLSDEALRADLRARGLEWVKLFAPERFTQAVLAVYKSATQRARTGSQYHA